MTSHTFTSFTMLNSSESTATVTCVHTQPCSRMKTWNCLPRRLLKGLMSSELKCGHFSQMGGGDNMISYSCISCGTARLATEAVLDGQVLLQVWPGRSAGCLGGFCGNQPAKQPPIDWHAIFLKNVLQCRKHWWLWKLTWYHSRFPLSQTSCFHTHNADNIPRTCFSRLRPDGRLSKFESSGLRIALSRAYILTTTASSEQSPLSISLLVPARYVEAISNICAMFHPPCASLWGLQICDQVPCFLDKPKALFSQQPWSCQNKEVDARIQTDPSIWIAGLRCRLHWRAWPKGQWAQATKL